MALIRLEQYSPNYQEQAPHDYNVTHFDVIAEGSEKVGTIDTLLVDESNGHFRYFVVDTGFWILGKKVLLPIALGRIIYMDRRVYVKGLTKEQVKQLPEYTENLTITGDYEEQVRAVLRPMVKGAISKSSYTPETYDLSQEPYFYHCDDQILKSTQDKLTETKHQRHHGLNH